MPEGAVQADTAGDATGNPAGNSAATGQAARTLTVDDALAFAKRQVRALVDRVPERVPTFTENGKWVIAKDPWAPNWSGGFFAGMLWIFAAETDDEWWRKAAERYTISLEPRKDDPATHDIGFLLEPSWGRWYDVEGDRRARDVLVAGGRTMANRFQRHGQYLRSFVDPGSTFIDIMMNVGIIFRAARYSSDDRLADIALRHSRTSRRFLMRGDGSTAHEGWFDVLTGEFLRTATHQGWRSDSDWARGQAWAIYGFTAAYRYSDAADMLDSACRAADYYMEKTADGGVPPNDWADPSPVTPYESSAAAIAACGFLHLAEAVGDPAREAAYRAYGLAILRTLRSTEFIAADTVGWEGILKHATYHHENKLAVDESVMWGDYYLVEALDLARRLSERGDSE